MAKSLGLARLSRISSSIILFLGSALCLIALVASILSSTSTVHSRVACRFFGDPGCRSRRVLSLVKISGLSHPTVTIFAAPIRPFSNTTEDPHYQALLSWLMLSPTPEIILLGNDPSFHRISDQFPGRVSVDPRIDYNMMGTPMFHSMFARAQQTNADISVLVNGDILLLQDFMEALHKTHATHEDWVLFGQHWNLDLDDSLPISFARKTAGIVEMQSRISDLPLNPTEAPKFVRSNGMPDPKSTAIDFWAWNNNEEAPLLTTPMPPFSLDRGSYEKWVVQHIIEESVTRAVVDAAEAIASLLISGHPPTASGSSSERGKAVNLYLSSLGNGTDGGSGPCDVVAPWRLIHCAEPSVQNLCMIAHEQRIAVSQNDEDCSAPENLTRRNEDARLDHVFQVSLQLGVHPWQSHAPDFPPTLDALLPRVADENRVVVMVGLTSNYKEMLLSFICRVQSLGVKNVLVAAFDEALFEYAYAQGLPVYFENSAEDYQSLIGSDGECIFASECFQRVSKLKSWSVLRVLRKGYSVLWSDIDIVWFENPLKELLQLGPGTLPIQSDEPNEAMPENNIRGANSGFYLARSEETTIKAFEAIVGHAMGTRMTEQPSFYDVLCGENGERRVGTTECKMENGLRVIFLSHVRFPNGYVMRHWEDDDPANSCRKQGCVLLHNNFISGKENKLLRLVLNRLWYYDVPLRMCLHPWHPLSPNHSSLPSFQSYFLHSLHLPPPPITP